MHVTEFMYVSTTVGDLRRTETFYGDGLGLTRVGEAVIEDPAWARLMGVESAFTVRALRMRLGTQEIELVNFDPPGAPYPEPRAGNDRWFQHIAIVASDIDDAYERLESRSPTHISTHGPQLLPANTGGVTAFKFRDPDGHPLELLYLPPDVGDAAWHSGKGSEPMGYDHSAIVVEDVERSIAFYTNLLGFRVSGRSLNTGIEQDRLDGLTNCVVDVVGLEPAEVPTPHLELLCYRRPPGRTQTKDIDASEMASTRQVHRVDDLEGLVGRLRNAGVTFVSTDIVTLRTGDRAAAIRDPDGHIIVLMQ